MPTLSVAPMLDCTDRHERFLLRMLSQHTELYTEMVVAQTLRYREPDRWLNYHPAEHPLILQLAGDNPPLLASATKIATDWGYDGINLNVGCPSTKVISGHFGACLFLEPSLVASCIEAMCAASTLPISVKTRIGVDTHDTYPHLHQFISLVSSAGCSMFILHARKAWLTGLNPAQNRTLPPLQYPIVYQLKNDFPTLKFIINGGLNSIKQAWDICHGGQTILDGAMIGRAAYANPYLIADADRIFYQDHRPIPKPFELLAYFFDYLQAEDVKGGEFRAAKRHLQGLFQGQTGARTWRKLLGEASTLNDLRHATDRIKHLAAASFFHA